MDLRGEEVRERGSVTEREREREREREAPEVPGEDGRGGSCAQGKPKSKLREAGTSYPTAPLPSLPFWRIGSWTAPFSQILNPPWEEYVHMHIHTCAHASAHTEEGSPGEEQSRAEHLDLPLVTHSGIRGTDGKRDGERECTLGSTHTHYLHPGSNMHKHTQTHASAYKWQLQKTMEVHSDWLLDNI